LSELNGHPLSCIMPNESYVGYWAFCRRSIEPFAPKRDRFQLWTLKVEHVLQRRMFAQQLPWPMSVA
jgi:hypothetical protein